FRALAPGSWRRTHALVARTRQDRRMPVWLGVLIGAALFAVTWTGVVSTLVVPRPSSGPGRLSIVINRSTRAAFLAVSRFASTYEGKDAVLSPMGPVAVLAQLVAWLLLLATAFVVMLVP